MPAFEKRTSCGHQRTKLSHFNNHLHFLQSNLFRTVLLKQCCNFSVPHLNCFFQWCPSIELFVNINLFSCLIVSFPHTWFFKTSQVSFYFQHQQQQNLLSLHDVGQIFIQVKEGGGHSVHPGHITFDEFLYVFALLSLAMTRAVALKYGKIVDARHCPCCSTVFDDWH